MTRDPDSLMMDYLYDELSDPERASFETLECDGGA